MKNAFELAETLYDELSDECLRVHSEVVMPLNRTRGNLTKINGNITINTLNKYLAQSNSAKKEEMSKDTFIQ